MKKFEWSKMITILVILFFGIYGIWSGIEYYRLTKIAIELGAVPPDPTLAVTCVTTILGALLSYCLYQYGCKSSRNKYGIDADGMPFVKKNEDEDNLLFPSQNEETLDEETTIDG